jgi:hypothetical protein
VPSSLPRERPAPLRIPSAVCCLHPDMTGSATPPFGCLSHEAAKFTLRIGPAGLPPSVQAIRPRTGLLTLRSDVAFSGAARSLLHGAPALTAAGLPPASPMQHRSQSFQTRSRSGRTMWKILVDRRREG